MSLLLDDDNLKIVVNNVAVTEDGRKLLGHLLESSRVFLTGIKGDVSRDAYNRGRADFGLELREIIINSNIEQYFKILKEANKDNG